MKNAKKLLLASLLSLSGAALAEAGSCPSCPSCPSSEKSDVVCDETGCKLVAKKPVAKDADKAAEANEEAVAAADLE